MNTISPKELMIRLIRLKQKKDYKKKTNIILTFVLMHDNVC